MQQHAAVAGMSAQQIMARAGWSSADSFCQHYYRPPAEATNAVNFGQAGAIRSTICGWLRLLGS